MPVISIELCFSDRRQPASSASSVQSSNRPKQQQQQWEAEGAPVVARVTKQRAGIGTERNQMQRGSEGNFPSATSEVKERPDYIPAFAHKKVFQ